MWGRDNQWTKIDRQMYTPQAVQADGAKKNPQNNLHLKLHGYKTQ